MNLTELIKDIEKNGEGSRYIDLIKKEYPYLLGILENSKMIFNPDTEKVRKIGWALQEKTNNYCPCVIKRDEDTLCPCKKMREDDECICGLYIRK